MKFTNAIDKIKEDGLYRQTQSPDCGRINFCANDYLGLKNHPQVVAAFKRGADKFGVGAGASHLVGGHSFAHQQLQEVLADYTGQEKALLFSSGYMANLGVFSALKEVLNWVLQDKLNHASLLDANQLIGLPLQRYLHNNTDALSRKIARQSGAGLVATDSVFSMDGDRADISKIGQITKQSGSIFYQDDAHGFGMFAPNIPKNSIYMATLGKAAGTMGAFVAGDADLIDFLVQKSRPYIYTTAHPPALCMATMQSLELIKNGEQRAKLFANIEFFTQFSAALELPIEKSDSAIFPLIIGDNKKTVEIAQKLSNAGFYVGAIRPPTVPKNTQRLRITLSSEHTQSQIEQLLLQIKDAL